MEFKASKDMTVQIITVGVAILFAFLGYKSIIGLFGPAYVCMLWQIDLCLN